MRCPLIMLAAMTSLGASAYDELEEVLPFNPAGWYGRHLLMEELIYSKDVKTVIEVGSFVGASTRHIAKCLEEGSQLYAVDHWLGSEEHQPGAWAEPAFLLEELYPQFLSNMIHAKVTDKVIPVRKPSLEAAASLNVLADLIYLDAAHDTQSVYADLMAWIPHLKPGAGCLWEMIGHGTL